MAVYDLEEQEQIDELKAWWNTYGNFVTAIVVAISLAVVGWKAWGWYESRQSAEASVIFGALQQAHRQHDLGRVKNLSGELTEKYSGTVYAPLGALLAAQASAESDDLKTAKAQLSWAVKNAQDEVRATASLRLAGVLLDEGAFDEALQVLASEKMAAYQSRVLALKGDVLLAKGLRKEARAAYVAAREAQQKDSADEGQAALSQLLEQKIEQLGDAA